MSRAKGLPKTGGRQKGTPNKRPVLSPTPVAEAAQLRALARQYTAAAIETLAWMMQFAGEGATRVAAAKALLDRHFRTLRLSW